MTKRGISLFFLFIFSVSILFAQEIVTAEKYLEQVSDNYAGIRDYEANVTILSGNSNMAGSVSYLTPSYIRIDFTRPAEQVIVYNREVLTIYLPEFRAVLSQDVRSSGHVLATSQGLSILRTRYVTSFLTGPNPEPLDANSNEKVVKLRLSRRSVSEGFRELILCIDADTKLIRRISGTTIAGGEVSFDFTNIKTNIGVPEARFIYDAPGSANMYNNFLFRDSD